jgi:hypothetical protein
MLLQAQSFLYVKSFSSLLVSWLSDKEAGCHIDTKELLCTVLMFSEGRCVLMYGVRVHSHRLLSSSAWFILLISAYVKPGIDCARGCRARTWRVSSQIGALLCPAAK